MSYRYVVLGAGRQGTAAGYDLARCGEAREVLFADADEASAARAAARVDALLGRRVARAVAVDGGDASALATVLEGADGVLSALPYALNAAVTVAAIRAGAHLADLGGNTDVVRVQISHDAAAKAADVSVVPDCGIAPGLANALAALAVADEPAVQHVHIRCGGLPTDPKPPLGYKLVFHIGGLTNEYTGEGEFLREGRPVRVPALTEPEMLDLPAPLGRCEARVTSGGTSTAPETFHGRLLTYDYKTIRYPGHFDRMEAIAALGLLDLEPIEIDGRAVVPREVFHRCAQPRLAFPGDRDLLFLRVRALDARGRVVRQYDLLDFHDTATGFSAMERCTAFPAAATLHEQVKGAVAAGVAPPERSVATRAYLAAVVARGLAIAES